LSRGDQPDIRATPQEAVPDGFLFSFSSLLSFSAYEATRNPHDFHISFQNLDLKQQKALTDKDVD